MAGVKETVELIRGLGTLGAVIGKLAKDGLQWSDGLELATLLTSNEEYRDSLVEAVKGFEKLDDEFKDLQPDEVFQLLSEAYAQYNKIRGALKDETA